MNAVSWKTSTPFALAILVVLAGLIHIPFQFNSYYGEPDAARLVNDALLWLRTGMRTVAFSEYRYYTSPGYIWLAKQLIPLSSLSGGHPALYLNALNQVVIILIVIPAFIFYRRLTDHLTAFLSTVVLSFIPAFWMSGLYGFPHLLSIFFMLWAILLYDQYLTGSSSFGWQRLIPVVLLLTASVLFKADIYLSAVVIVGLNIYRQKLMRQQLLVATGVLLIPVLISLAISKLLLWGAPSTVTYLQQWNQEWGVYPSNYYLRGNIEGIFMSMGALSIPVFLLSFIYLARSRRYSLALLLFVWAMIPLLFWSSRAGDSSRHHAQVSLAIALGVGIFLRGITKEPSRCFALMLVLIGTNYFFFPPSSSTLKASGDLARSSQLIKERVAQFHDKAEEFTEIDVGKKALLCNRKTCAYVENEILLAADVINNVELSFVPGCKKYKGGCQMKTYSYTMRGKEYESNIISVERQDENLMVPSTLSLIASNLRDQGYRVYSSEYGTSTLR